ncbi:hypothetical protein EDB19DRAFT_1076179 [Suillus lakei]|nr:hypothetical protein EDB19DRAFT_1076179 [Suillus lakei]
MIMTLCQCVVTSRVWHLFPRSRLIRGLAVTVLIVCIAAAAAITGVTFNVIKTVYAETAPPQNTGFLFTIYLPALVVHTVMLLLKMYRFYISPRALQRHGIIYRVVKEGMFMYAFAAGTLLYEIISLSMTEPEDMSIYYSALVGEIAVANTTVSVCRAMLSIRSLAATYHVDPAWLLNHAELSRVQWRRGDSEGEILVEVNEMDTILPTSPVLPARKLGGEDDM